MTRSASPATSAWSAATARRSTKRIDRKISTPQALLQRIATCNAQVGAGWFPEDEEHAAAYLNQQYYKFK